MFLLKGLIITLLYGFIFNHRIESVQGLKVCKTSKQEDGLCMSMRKCHSVIEQLKVAEQDRFSKYGQPTLSFCGYWKGQPTVCCPPKKHSLKPIKEKSLYSDVLPSAPNCGLINRSTNLQRTTTKLKTNESGLWPWMAMLGYRRQTELKFWMCGGVLVSRRFVVTAAHCKSLRMVSVYKKPPIAQWLQAIGNFFDNMLKYIFSLKDEIDPSNMIVRLGVSPVHNVTGSGIYVLVEKILVHQGYSQKTLNNDIALIKLMEDIVFTPSIQPICLPMSNNSMVNDFFNLMPFVAGWGTVVNRKQTSETMRQTTIPVLPLNVCRTVYTDTYLNITNNQICAGFARVGNPQCLADSGGPLMLANKHVMYIIGIESFGRECAKTGYPDIYTRVSNYLPWIAKTIKENS